MNITEMIKALAECDSVHLLQDLSLQVKLLIILGHWVGCKYTIQ